MLILGDCLEELRKLEADSVDALVTDPPAGINFMNKAFDSDRGGREQWIAWLQEISEQCLRVLKPGAHGLVWALPRTSHWTATALENAGFEIRDVVNHLFGSGFPKSTNIGKQIDKMLGAEREVVGKLQYPASTNRIKTLGRPEHSGSGWQDAPDITAPATPEAKQWDGWGSALKPACENWILVRKPLGEKTLAKNVLRHGTGGINVDACRVGNGNDRISGGERGSQKGIYSDFGHECIRPSGGRFPANLLLSHLDTCELVGTKEVKGIVGGRTENRTGFSQTTEILSNKNYANENGKETVEAFVCSENCPVAEVDRQSGMLGVSARKNRKSGYQDSYVGGKIVKPVSHAGFADSGGASRFFKTFEAESEIDFAPGFQYMAKASRKDRGEGNTHPTVKNTRLCEYLIKLITPPNGVVLDPFAGSGSTLVAAKRLGFQYIGIEKEREYYDIASNRLANEEGGTK